MSSFARAVALAASSQPIAFRYRIHGKEANKLPFVIDRASGQLRLKTRIERATRSRYEFSIVAKLDGVEDRGFLDVIVDVRASNRHCPDWTSAPSGARLFVVSNTPVGAELTTLAAIDRDADSAEGGDESTALVYKLAGVNGSEEYFEVDALRGTVSLGYHSIGARLACYLQLRLAKPLPSNVSRLQIRLLALDNGWPRSHFSSLLLTINIVLPGASSSRQPIAASNASLALPSAAIHDSCRVPNAHAPRFVGASEFTIAEDAARGTEVGRVRALDADDSFAGIVQFVIVGGDTFFGVHPLSGRIFVRSSLEALFASGATSSGSRDQIVHELEICAHDFALNNSKNTTTKIRILVNGANTHSPIFDKVSERKAFETIISLREAVQKLIFHACS